MRQLIIVCEERLRHYGDFLSQLASIDAGKDRSDIGVPSGSVSTHVWTKKEYAKNAANISSEQYILFIGNTKLFKTKRSHMIKQYSKFGMQYGWLGKQAVLFVEKAVEMKEYEKFVEYVRVHYTNVMKLIDSKSDVIITKNSTDKLQLKETKRLLNLQKFLPETIVNAPVKVLNAFTKKTNEKKIKEQEYTCLVLVFYSNGLSKFLGLSKK